MTETVAQRDFHADRNVWFIRKLAWIGRDFTGATFFMQIRAVRDTTGTPPLNLTNANPATDPYGIALLYAGTATISAHIAAGRLDGVPAATNPATGQPYQATDSILLSQIEIFIDNLHVRALPFPIPPDELGNDVVLQHDLLVEPSGGVPDVEISGKFILRAGVTIA